MAELIFLDLEWNTTFYRNKSGERVPFHELIEVAAMKVEQDTGAMLDSFHSYIHPKASRKLESRTYRVSSDSKAYRPNMGGYSIFGWALDGSDPGVRLEAYMAAEKGGPSGWKVDYCYMEEGA